MKPHFALSALKQNSRAIRYKSVGMNLIIFIEICCAIEASVIRHVIRDKAATYDVLIWIWFFAGHSVEEFADSVGGLTDRAFLLHGQNIKNGTDRAFAVASCAALLLTGCGILSVADFRIFQ